MHLIDEVLGGARRALTLVLSMVGFKTVRLAALFEATWMMAMLLDA